jgi:hypothetical protein
MMVAVGPKDRTLPGGLELVRDFLNTRDVEAGTDELGTPGGVSDWCLRRGLLEAGEELGDPDRGRIVEVREGLREVLAERGANAGARGAGPLDRVARRSPLVVRFGRDGEPWLEPAAAGIERTIARILAVVFAAQASGHWARL